jgi:hypothetical protein
MTADLFSFAGLGAILIGLVVVGALIWGVSTSAEDASGFSVFLRPKRAKTDDARRKQP